MKTKFFRIAVPAAVIAVILITVLLLANKFGETGFRSVSSYIELQKKFNKDAATKPVYPDIAALQLDESSIQYQIHPYMAGVRNSAVRTYVICGEKTTEDRNYIYSFVCSKGPFESEYIRDPILYRNVEMEVRSVVNEEPPYVYANCYIQGYKYSLSVFIRQWNDCSAEEIEAIHSQLQDELYSFMCGIIDVIKMTEDTSPGRFAINLQKNF